MPTLRVNGVGLHYEEARPDGEAEASAPEAVVFAHGLLFDRRIFERPEAVTRVPEDLLAGLPPVHPST